MKITEKIVNVQTGEETIIERNETTDEKKAREALEKEFVAAQAAEAAKAAQKQAVLDRLGLTAEEAQLLLGGN